MKWRDQDRHRIPSSKINRYNTAFTSFRSETAIKISEDEFVKWLFLSFHNWNDCITERNLYGFWLFIVRRNLEIRDVRIDLSNKSTKYLIDGLRLCDTSAFVWYDTNI